MNDKVDTLSQVASRRTQERTARQRGADRRSRPEGAGGRPEAPQAAGQRAEAGAGAAADAVNTRADAIEKASKRLVYEVVLSEDKGNFKFGKADDAGRGQGARSISSSQQLKADPNGAYIEIEGHTDNVGDKDINYKLGLERAENVKRYLYEQHQVPLHKINVISYGEEKPVAPNKTKDGRAQNRRVVIKVLDLDRASPPRGTLTPSRVPEVVVSRRAVDRGRSAGGRTGMVRYRRPR